MCASKNILYGGYEGPDEEVCLNTQSLGEALINSLRANGHRIVLVDGFSGEEISAHTLLTKAISVARYLQDKFNIKSGDVISICSENRIEFSIVIHATLYLGATIAPLNHSYVADEMNHAINLSKPKIIFVSPSNLKKIMFTARKHSFIKQVILFDNDVQMNLTGESTPLPFTQIIETETNANDFKCKPQDVKENVAAILCSSGTTGLPKGVQLTQFNFFIASVQYHGRLRRDEMPPSGDPVILGNLPLFHAYGLNIYLIISLARATNIYKIVLIPRFVEEDFLRCIQTQKVTTAYFVPPIMVLLAKSPLVDKYDLSSLHSIICGAAPLGKKTEIEVKNRIGVKVVRQGYGMTEGTFAFCTQNDIYHTNGSVGVLYKGVYGRVIDIETGKCLGARQEGELHFKGPNTMKGYIGNKQATSATIDADGWLHTGDIGYFDENCEWYVTDRIKELIKYKGFQVPPAEIEAVLLTNPHIKDAGVIGVPNELAGELAFAFVVKQAKAQITEGDVLRYVADRLSHPKRLHGGVKFIDTIPKSMSGKILRRVLRDMAKNHKFKL